MMNILSKFAAWHHRAECEGKPLAMVISLFALIALMASASLVTVIAAAVSGGIK